MNSKNLSKAINRMLAILLTAAMVAGSFTVPVKATENESTEPETEVVEVQETSEPVVENETSTGEEASEEAEEVLPIEEEQPAAAEEITEEGVENPDGIGTPGVFIELNLTEDDLKKLNKEYDGVAVAKTDIVGSGNPNDASCKIKIYGDSEEKSTLSGTINTITISKSDGKGGWMTLTDDDITAGGIKDANTYRIVIEAYDSTTGLSDRLEKSFTISKCNVTDWLMGVGDDDTSKAQYSAKGTVVANWNTSYSSGSEYMIISNATTPKYTVADSGEDGEDEQGNPFDINVERSLDVKELSKVVFSKPTGGAFKSAGVSDDFYTALESGEINSNEADFELVSGKGDNNLTNATVSENTADYYVENEDRPYVLVTLKGMTNFEGTIKVPFKVAGAENSEVTTDVSKVSPVTVEIPSPAANVPKSIKINDILAGKLKDAKGNLVPLEIEKVTIGTITGTNFFTKDEEGDANITYTTGKNATLDFSVLKSAHGSAKIPVTIKVKNYAELSAVNVVVNVVDGSDTSDTNCTITVDSSDTHLDNGELVYIYDDDKPTVSLVLKDTNGQEKRADDNQFSDGFTIKAYYYLITDSGKKLVSGANLSDANPTVTLKKYSLEAGAVLEPGSYEVRVIYDSTSTDSGAVATNAVKIIPFTVKKNDGGAFKITAANDEENNRYFATSKSVPLESTGGVLKYGDLTVQINNASGNKTGLGEDDYTITPNETNNKKVYDLDAKCEKLKVKYPDAGLAGTYTSDAVALEAGYNTTFKDEFKKEKGLYIVDAIDSKHIFADEPYVTISIGGKNDKGLERFSNVADVYVSYQIGNGSAKRDSTNYTGNISVSAKKAASDGKVSVDLKGAYLVDGKAADAYLTKYSVVAHTSPGTAQSAVRNFDSEATTTLEFNLKDGTTAAALMGKTVIYTLTPTFEGYTADGPLDITVTFQDEAEVELSLDSSVYDAEKTTITYNGNEKVEVGKVKKSLKVGGEVVDDTQTNFDAAVIYRLESEVTTTKSDLASAKFEYDGAQGGTKGTYTRTINGNSVTATNAGNYIAVSGYKSTATASTGYKVKDDKKGVVPFVILPYNITTEATTAALTKNDGGTDGKVKYKDTDYNSIFAAGATGLATLTDANITGGITETKDFNVVVGAVTAPKTADGDYTIPIAITAKENGNFVGTINKNYIIAKQTNAPTGISLKFAQPKTFTYDGKEHTPVAIAVINGNEYEIGVDTLPDPYMTASVSYNNTTLSKADDITDAGSITGTLKLGGLYNVDNAGTDTYTISKGNAADLKDTEIIEVNISELTTEATSTATVSLPKYFVDNAGKKFAVNYSTASVTPTKKDGWTGTSDTGTQTIANGILTATFTLGKLVKGDEVTYKITGATIENYNSKDVTVHMTVSDADKKIEATSVEIAKTTFDSKPLSLADLQFTGLKQAGVSVLPGAISGGKLSVEWYKEVGTSKYEPVEEKDTVNVGTYKAIVKLEDAVDGFWMTPIESGTKAIGALAVTDADIDSIVINKENIVYDGTVKYPEIIITLKKVGMAGVVVDVEHDLTLGGGSAAAGAKTMTRADNNNGNYSGLAASSKWPTGWAGFTVEKRPVALNIAPETTVAIDATNKAAVAYGDIMGETTGLVEGDVVTVNDADIKVEIQNAWDSAGNKVTIPANKELYTKPGKYEFKVSAIGNNSIKTNGTAAVGNNYELDPNRTSGILVVQEPEKIDVDAEVKVGDTVVANGKKTIATGLVTATLTNKKTSKALTENVDYTMVVKNSKGLVVTSATELDTYTVSFESTYNGFTFDAFDVEFTVVDKIPYEVKSVEVSPASVKFSKVSEEKTVSYTVTGQAEGSDPEAVNEAIKVEPSSSANFSVTDDGKGTLTVKALTDKKGISETFEISVVSAPEIKATLKLSTEEDKPGAGEATTETPVDDDEYTTLDDATRETKSFVEIKAGITKLSKASYTYNGKPCTPNPTVKATVDGKSVTLVKDQDYRVVYEENINAGIATVRAYGINDYIGTVSYRFQISPKKTSSLKVFTSSATVDEDEDICDVEDIGLTVYDGTTPLGDEDYTASLTLDKGKGVLIIKGQGNYTGDKKVTVPVVNLKNKDGYIADVTLDEDSFVYDGTKHEPKVTVTALDAEGNEIETSSYSVKYSNQVNPGVGYVTVTGKGKITGKVVRSFTIEAATQITAANVKLSKAAYVYNGKLQSPKVTVTDPVNTKKKLTLNKDYRVEYHNNLNVGTACVDIIGMGSYEGQELRAGLLSKKDAANLQYTISPADISGVKVEKDKSTGKIAKITYKKRVLVAGTDYDAVIVSPKSGKLELQIYGHYNYGDEPEYAGNFCTKKNPKKQSIKAATDVDDSIIE